MIHECKVYCHVVDITIDGDKTSETMGEGKWLPFAFNISLVDAVKMSSDEVDDPLYKLTSVFLQSGETYMIDTPYKEFLREWKLYLADFNEGDLEL
jgi:hypothetical protein